MLVRSHCATDVRSSSDLKISKRSAALTLQTSIPPCTSLPHLNWDRGTDLPLYPILSLFEPEAITVHLEYMDVMSKPVEQRACQSLGPNTPVHSSKGRLLVTVLEPRSRKSLVAAVSASV